MLKKQYKSFMIADRFDENDKRVHNAVKGLNSAHSDSVIVIVFKNNGGGHVESVERLIRAIEKTKAKKVQLVFHGFAVSAAAYIFAYFTFYAPKDHIFPIVNSQLCMVYHKPRVEKTNVLVFSNYITDVSTNEPSKKHILKITPYFDNVFQAMIDILKLLNFNIAPHMKEIYNINGDVTIIFNKGFS